MEEIHNFIPKVIILPCGCGKTTYAKKYPEIFIDIDTFIETPETKENMKSLRNKAIETNDWNDVINLQKNIFTNKLKNHDSQYNYSNYIYLIHSQYMFGIDFSLNILGSAKLPEKEILLIAKERGLKNKQWQLETIYNWKSSNIQICTRQQIDIMIEKIIENNRN